MRVAAVDCGTNSIRLLVADGPDGGSAGPDARQATLTDVERRVEFVRLGHGVDATGVIASESMRRALAMTWEYAARCDELGVEVVRFVTTSAARDARNAGEFIAGVRMAFDGRDVSPEVLTGDQEAHLSFLGATGGLAASGAQPPYLVVDVGGGSTEFVRGGAGADHDRVQAGRSVDMGCVRLTERHLREIPPTREALAAALAEVDAQLDRVDSEVGFDGVGTLVGLAGTVTTVTAHALGLPTYDSHAIHLARLEAEQVLQACDDLLASDRARLAALPYMHPGRVDVIGAGALIWGRIVARVAKAAACPVLTSEHDILDGIAMSLLRER